MPKVQIEGLSARAALRNSELRKLNHAIDVLTALCNKHDPGQNGERQVAELEGLKARMTQLIRNQHIIDPEYAAHRAVKVPEGL